MYNRVITCNHIHISFILFRKMASADLPSYPDLDAEIHMLCPLKKAENPSESVRRYVLWGQRPLAHPAIAGSGQKKTSPRS